MAVVVDRGTLTQLQSQVDQLQGQADSYTQTLALIQSQLAAWRAVLSDAVPGDPITQTPEGDLQPEG